MIQVVCYRCGDFIREDPRGDGTSHGLCRACYIEEMIRLYEDRRRLGYAEPGDSGREAKAACNRYLKRDMRPGHELDDWLEARQCVLAGKTNVAIPLSPDTPAKPFRRERSDA